VYVYVHEHRKRSACRLQTAPARTPRTFRASFIL
jgi:hypothetical protein